MSGLVPMCDSDEEEFYGPITAREIELDWRRLIAEKNKKRLDASDQPASNSEKALNQTISASSVNEPLHESILKNSSIRFIDDDEYTMDVDAEPILVVNRSDFVETTSVQCGNVESASDLKIVELNNSGLNKTTFKEFDTGKDGNNISTVPHLLENTTDQIMSEISGARLIETSFKELNFAEGDYNASAKLTNEEDKTDQNITEVTGLKLNEMSIKEYDFVEGENNASVMLCNVKSPNNKNMSEIIGVKLNDTSVNESNISKGETNTSIKLTNLEDSTYRNMADVTRLSLNEISIKDSSIAVGEINASGVLTNAEEASEQNLAQIIGSRLNERSVETNFAVGENNPSVMFNCMKGIDQNMTEITELSLNEMSVKESNFVAGEKNTSFMSHMGGDTNQTVAEVTGLRLNETNVMESNVVEVENNTSAMLTGMKDSSDQIMAEVTGVRLNETNVMETIVAEGESNTSAMLTSTEDATDQNMGEVTGLGVNETNYMDFNVAEDENNAVEDTSDQKVAIVTGLQLNEVSVKETNASEGESNASAMLTNTEDAVDQNIDKVSGARLNETNDVEFNVAEDENNASVMLTSLEDTTGQKVAVVTGLQLNEISVKDTNVTISESNASTMLTNTEDTVDQNIDEVTGVRLNETNITESNVAQGENNASAMLTNVEDVTAQNIDEVTDSRLSELSIKESDFVVGENNASITSHNGEGKSDQNMPEITSLMNETPHNVSDSIAEQNNALTMFQKVEDSGNQNADEVTCTSEFNGVIVKMVDHIPHEKNTAPQLPLKVTGAVDQTISDVTSTSLELTEANVEKFDLLEDKHNASTVSHKVQYDTRENLSEFVPERLNESEVMKPDFVKDVNISSSVLYISESPIDKNTTEGTCLLGLNNSNVKKSDLLGDKTNSLAMLCNMEGTTDQNLTEIEMPLKDETFADKSLISVKGENHYEVYIPVSPSPMKLFHNSTYNQSIMGEKTFNESVFTDKTMISVKGDNRYEVYVPFAQMDSTVNGSVCSFMNATGVSVADNTIIDLKHNEGVNVTHAEVGVMEVVEDVGTSLHDKGGPSSNFEDSKIHHSFREENVHEVSLRGESERTNEIVGIEHSSNNKNRKSLFNESVPKKISITQEKELNDSTNKINTIDSSVFGNRKSHLDTSLLENCHDVPLSNSCITMENEEANNEVKLYNGQKVDTPKISKLSLIEKSSPMECSELNDTVPVHKTEDTAMDTSFHGSNESYSELSGLNTVIQPILVNQLESIQLHEKNNARAGYDIQESEGKNRDETDCVNKTPRHENNTSANGKLPTSISKNFMKDENMYSSDNESSFTSANDDVAQPLIKSIEINSSPLNKISESSFQDNKKSKETEPVLSKNNSSLLNNDYLCASESVNISTTSASSNEQFVRILSIDDNTNPQVLDNRVESLALDQKNIVSEDNLDIQEFSENKSESGDSSDKSFVSLKSNEELSSEDKCVDGMQYVPPGKKQCIQSTPGKEHFTRPTPCKNKENEDPKSRIPVPSASKLPVLRPPTLKLDNFVNSTPWASDFRKKKIPQPKKPDYVVSPGKLDRLLKTTPVNKQIRPRTAESTIKSTPIMPLKSSGRITSTPNILSTPQSSLKLKSPASLKQFPGLTKKKVEVIAPLKTPPKNAKFKDISSPVGEYIKNPPSVIRNVTPSKVNPSDISTGKNKENRENIAKSPKPEVLISPKYYSSANKRVLKSSNINKSPLLPKMGERQTAVFSVSPKIQVLKHTGRVLSGEKNHGEETAGIVRPARKTSLNNTSFAELPPSSDLDMSVVQKL